MTKFTEAKSAGVTFTGRIRKDTGSGVVLELNSAACDGCRSCTSDRLVQVPLPEDDYAHNAQIVLSLGYRKQWQLAFNSLILPILCLITGAALAEVFSGSEQVVLLSAALSFGAGILMCRRFTTKYLQLDEVDNP